jgi:glutamine cyclotransferase
VPSPVTRALGALTLPFVGRALPLALGLTLLTGGCGAPAPSTSEADAAASAASSVASSAIRAGLAGGVALLRPTVLGTLAHDTDAWTEGLELDGGVLYEGTGLAGRSELRELDPSTGRPLRAAPLPSERYGEGITVFGDRIWQLTYTDHVALPWDRRTLRAGPAVPYPGQGWGLCHTGGDSGTGALVASDGSDRLRILSGADLRPLGTVGVRIAGRPLPALNELECVPGAVWANVYKTDYLARIDLASGAVTAIVDASALVPASVRAQADFDTLNGIASVPGGDQFLLTGKDWPTIFRVTFTR